MEQRQLKIPEVGEFLRGTGKLLAVEIIPPDPPKTVKDYIFEDIEARCELRLNGETLKELETLSDFYGQGTGLATAIDEMTKYASVHGFTKDSEVEIVVIKVVSQRRMRPNNRETYYAKGYTEFSSLSIGSLRDLPEPVETVAWSSKYPVAPKDGE